MSESLFEAYDPQRFYGSLWPGGTFELAHRCVMIDRAIRSDDWPRVKEAIDLGWLTPECRAFDNSHVVDYCLSRNARAVALELRALGWPEYQRAAA
jgi:hypothetical protein